MPAQQSSTSTPQPTLPYGTPAFERALAFWEVEMQKFAAAKASMESGGLADREQARRAMAEHVACEMRDLDDLGTLNQLIMQAPL